MDKQAMKEFYLRSLKSLLNLWLCPSSWSDSCCIWRFKLSLFPIISSCKSLISWQHVEINVYMIDWWRMLLLDIDCDSIFCHSDLRWPQKCLSLIFISWNFNRSQYSACIKCLLIDMCQHVSTSTNIIWN